MKKDEKFLAGLKAAIESACTKEVHGFKEGFITDHKLLNIEAAAAAVVKFLEEQQRTYMQIDPETIQEQMDDLAKKRDQKLRSLFASPHWIPIEEAELVDGEVYDVFVPTSKRQRLCNAVYTPKYKLFDLISGHAVPISEVTHIMKRPADPEI